MARIAMLGTGLIGRFYTQTLHGQRSRDRVVVVYSRTEEKARAFAAEHGIPRWTCDLQEAIRDAEADTVVIGLPNNQHRDAALLAAGAGKAVLCTKPLGRTAAEAREMLEAVERAGVFHGYLEDLAYTPKTLSSLQSVRNGALGRVLWARSRETHPGPHSDWFWTKAISGGGALVDMGCHCIEINRNFIGKDVRPVEAMCWMDTQVHPIEAEDSAIGLVRYANGAIGQFEVSWTFRGGMDLRDEVSGTQGTIWLNHWLRTGYEMFTAAGQAGYVAEKAEGETGWLFPVGDETGALGYNNMFADMLDARDRAAAERAATERAAGERAASERGAAPMETFYDGYVVNAIIDACYKSAESKRWEPVQLDIWRGAEASAAASDYASYDDQYWLIKAERMADGTEKVILKDKQTGQVIQRVSG